MLSDRWSLSRLFKLLSLVLCFLLVAGCASAPAVLVSGEGASQLPSLPDEVSAETVAELTEAGEITVIDVREDWEFADGRIPGARHIPLGTLQDRLDEIPTDDPVVMVCRSGSRSGQAFTLLSTQGFDNVSNMKGGMTAWRALGLEVEQ